MILHTKIYGDGEPIVFLHTGLQTGTTDFTYQREFFKENYKVILPDLRGHGSSIENDLSNYFEDSAEDLAETLTYLEVESTHIVGCSIGALVGLVFAKRFPDRVKSVTLSGILHEKPDNWIELNNEDVKHQSQLLENAEAVEHFDALHEADWRHTLKIAQDANWYPFEATKDLDGIDSPILYVVGEGREMERKGALFYPSVNDHVHVSVIPFASHLVHLEQPEIYTQIVDMFIKHVT